MNLILASASPRRRELMELAGYDFSVEVSDVEETMIEGTPKELVEHLSSIKAAAVAERHQAKKNISFGDTHDISVDNGKNTKSETSSVLGDTHDISVDNGKNTKSETSSSTGDARDISVVIGADTVVILDGEILGKPKDEEDAFRMLHELSGRTHQVYTGVTFYVLREGNIIKRLSFSECTDVTMREISEEEIREYIDSGEPVDKAGAYGIQGKAAVFISGITGDYYNVVGLPVCQLTNVLKKIKMHIE